MKDSFDIKAAAALRSSKRLLQMATDDQDVNEAAYAVQQTVERILKHLLCQYGVPYPFSHKIDEIVSVAEESGIDRLCDRELMEFCRDNADTITRWETETRYNGSFFADYRKLSRYVDFLDAAFVRIFGCSCEEYKPSQKFLNSDLKPNVIKMKLD